MLEQARGATPAWLVAVVDGARAERGTAATKLELGFLPRRSRSSRREEKKINKIFSGLRVLRALRGESSEDLRKTRKFAGIVVQRAERFIRKIFHQFLCFFLCALRGESSETFRKRRKFSTVVGRTGERRPKHPAAWLVPIPAYRF